jgi:hypothetical protein
MPRMTIVPTAKFRARLKAAPNRATLAGQLGVSMATVDKLLAENRGVGVNTIAGALIAFKPLRFEDLFRVVADN